MSEANKRFMATWYDEVWNRKNLDHVTDMLAPDVVIWGEGDHAVPMRGCAAFRAFAENLHNAFSDIRFQVQHMVAEGDMVAARWRVEMTHTGPHLGFAPTGKRIVVTGTSTGRIKDGKLVEGWDNWDQLGMLHQLGRIADATPFL